MAQTWDDLSVAKPTELLGLYSRILDELMDRRLIWSRNAPAGDYAELLVAEAVGGRIARSSKKSWDVRDGHRRLQVKCRVVDAASKKSESFSPFRSFDFDACVFVVLDSKNYHVAHAAEVSRASVEASSTLYKWVAGSRVTVSHVKALTDARDVTEVLREAQVEVDKRGRRVEDDIEPSGEGW